MNGIDGFDNQIQENSDFKIDRGFHFTKAEDICKVPTTTNWLIKPYQDKDSISMIYGPPGTHKTSVGIDKGLSVSTGHDWHGNPVKQGPVFYIPGEGFSGLSRRIKAWSDHYKVPLQGVPFFVSDRPAALLEGPGDIIQAIDDLVKKYGTPDLIILDTLNNNFGPGDENSTADMTRFISACNEIRVWFHCAILIIHHSGLASTDRARGSSALRAALDWEYKLEKKSDGTVVLTCTKVKDHGAPPTLSFKPEVVTLDGWIDPDDGEVMTSCVLHRVEESKVTQDIKPLKGPKKIAYDALVSLGKSAHIDAWRDAAYSAGISPTSSSDAKRKAFIRAVTSLQDLGLVYGHDDNWKIDRTMDKRRTMSGHVQGLSGGHSGQDGHMSLDMSGLSGVRRSKKERL